MKRRNVLMFLLAMSLVATPIAYAQENAAAVTNAPQQERLEKNRTAYPLALNDEEKQQVAARCQMAQINLNKIRMSFSTVLNHRTEVYDQVDVRLSAVQKRLTAQELDTSIIDLLVAQYRRDTSALNEAAANYSVTLNDIIEMDCVSNPELFRSQLEAVRAARKRVVDEAEKLQSLVHADLAASFDSLKTKLRTLEQ